MQSKVEQTIAKYNMIDDTDKILVGLSGGADSIFLTVMLNRIYNGRVVCCHINHQIRDEADYDMNFCEQFCKQNDIEFHCIVVDAVEYSTKNKLSLELGARELRYKQFNKIKSDTNCTKIATAHNLSDSTETVLFNLARGTGVQGLCGIPKVRDDIVRPIIEISKPDIVTYLEDNGIKYVVDKTNYDNYYARNNIRNTIVPQLKQVNSNVEMNISNTTIILSEIQQYINKVATDVYAKSIIDNQLDLTDIYDIDVAVKREVIAIYLKEQKISVSFELINSIIIGMEQTQNYKQQVSSNLMIEIKNKKISICHCENVPDIEFEHVLELGEYSSPYKNYHFQLVNEKNVEIFKKNHKKLWNNLLDYDKIKGIVLLHSRKYGMSIKLHNRNCTKTIKKIYIEKKFTSKQKRENLLISDNDGLIYVEGFGCAKRVAIDDKTHNFLLITSNEL